MLFVPFIVLRSSLVMRALRRKWLHVQVVMGESVTVLQENLAGMHVVKAFASEDYERRKYDRKAEELRAEYYDAERMQGANSAWMTLYFTFALGVTLWLGGWLVIQGNLTAGELASFLLYLNHADLPHPRLGADHQHLLPRHLLRPAPVQCAGRRIPRCGTPGRRRNGPRPRLCPL